MTPRMRLLGLLLAVAPSAGGDEERGLALLDAGRFAEAAAAFRAAIEKDGPRPELCYNLALALWRAGDLDAAETAAEQAATLSDGALAALRDGILGNLRYAKAQAAEAEDPKAALQLAEQARDHYVRGAARPGGTPALARNLERTLKLIDELRRKIEEQEKQDQEQEKQDQQQQKQEQEQEQEQEQKEQKEQKEQEQQQEQQQQEQPGEPQPQPQPGEEQEPSEPEPSPAGGESKEPEPAQGEEPQEMPAPGEQGEARELTPEEKKRLLDTLAQIQAQLRELRAQQQAQRPKVKRDW